MRFIKIKKQQLILIGIICLGFFLRFYELSQNPPGVDWDEASSIYNGYSIAETGKDEYKEPYPILFKAYNAYVPPVLIYLDAVSASLFGLTIFAARFPVAFLGVLSILGIYLLSASFTQNKKLALFSALILSLSPWHITYSRVGTFASLPLGFIMFGTYFFIQGFGKKIFLVTSAFCFVVAVLSYYSAYVFVPLFLLALIFIYRKKIRAVHAFLLLLIVFLAAALLFLLPGGQVRMRGVSALSDPDLIKKDVFYGVNEVGGNLIHNRRFVYAQILFDGYFSNFRFDFLFGKADSVTRFIVPGSGFGLLYLWEFPLLCIGIYQLIRSKGRGWQVILIWLILSFVPTAPTFPKPASTRAFLAIPALTMLISYGLWKVITHKGKIVHSIVLLFIFGNSFLFLHQYFIHFPQEKSQDWFSPYKSLFGYLNQSENSEKKVFFIINQPDYLDEVHMFAAFYSKIDPRKYQLDGGTKIGHLGTVGEFSIGRYIFIPNECTRCGSEFSFQNDDLVVTAKKLSIDSVMVFPQNNQPSLFVYKMADVSLPNLVGNMH